ncbi:MAG TPA: HNH endonuclease signature motif containing protein, partial [Methylomirabilota bacterium]
AEQSRRIACDASRVIMKHDTEGRVIEVGARTRTIPPALRRALQSRDRGCRFPGCGSRFTQGHHIQHWANGGATTLSNLASLCRRHHRAVHEEGFTIERLANEELEFRHPNGWVLPQAPPLPAVPADAEAALRAQNAGVRLDARTLTPAWDGARLNVAWAIDCLHPRAIGH